MTELQALLHAGEDHLRASRPDLALPDLEQAYELAPLGAARMQISNTIARVRELMGFREEARKFFQATLVEPDTGEEALGEYRAIALNNLGRLSLPEDPEKGISFFDQAITIYLELSEEDGKFRPHLAHSYMARGEAYFLLAKFWFAKRDYKKALELGQNHEGVLSAEMRALVHYQLGAIYTDEFNAYDALTNYQKAAAIYKRLQESDPDTFLPLWAATINNLAVGHMQLEEFDRAYEAYQRTLQAYEALALQKPSTFTPYLASTCANTAILLGDHMGRFQEAYEVNQKAMEHYKILSEKEPGKYRHYLATACHNGGVYTLEMDSWVEAEADLTKALALRKNLAEDQKEQFGADFVATALNLLEYYQRMLEEKKAIGYKEKGLGLLKEVGAFLRILPEKPSTDTMRQDFTYFKTYFDEVDVEMIRVLEVLEKIRLWDQEIDSTLDLEVKTVFQDRILDELRRFLKEFPDNQALDKQLLLALNNRGWLHLCAGEVDKARSLLKEGSELHIGLAALECNLAHCELLEGNIQEAVERYQGLFGSRNESGTDFRKVVDKDLQKFQALQIMDDKIWQELQSLGLETSGV